METGTNYSRTNRVIFFSVSTLCADKKANDKYCIYNNSSGNSIKWNPEKATSI